MEKKTLLCCGLTQIGVAADSVRSVLDVLAVQFLASAGAVGEFGT
jgi:hypothetical protein